MNHHREGSGPPLVLAHGIGLHWQAWQPVIPALAREFEVLACDSPGFGGSAALRHAGPPTIVAYADAFEAWFREQELGRPHFAGNSMGGAIGLELARRGAVRSVTAFAPAGFWCEAERRWCQAFVGAIRHVPAPLRPALRVAVRTPAGRRALFPVLLRFPERLQAEAAAASLEAVWDAPALPTALAAFSEYDFRAPAEPWAAATTVAWGDRDRLLPYRRQAPRARARLPFAEHVTLGAGHLPVSDDPAAVVAAIRRTAAAAP